jgi:cytochrome c556
MRRRMWSALTLGAVLASAAGASLAQDKAALVESRQDFMDRQDDDVKAIAAFFKGTGDRATAVAKASDLLVLAPKIPEQFVPGTAMGEAPKSKAKPEIFRDKNKVKTLVANLQVLERKLLETVKDGDPAAVRAQLVATYREGCTACHSDYRAAEQ